MQLPLWHFQRLLTLRVIAASQLVSLVNLSTIVNVKGKNLSQVFRLSPMYENDIETRTTELISQQA